MKTKRMDIQMSDHTLKLETEIKKVNGVSRIKSRESIMAEAIERLHKKLCKPSQVIETMAGPTNE